MLTNSEILNNHSVVESKERNPDQLTYHHARPIESVVYGIVRQRPPIEYSKNKEDAEFYHRAYQWLENKLGFYPLFLAVGKTTEDIRMTGYQTQWGRNPKMYEDTDKNKVLFSFDKIDTKGVYIDYSNWHLVLNLSDRPKELERYEHSIFRPSWIKNDWITYSNKNPHSVQMVVPSLDLRTASEILVRNKKTQDTLTKMGFQNVKIERIKLS